MKHEQATIITFYSYKGGVGRSMALANVAWLLAESFNKKVLVVDWDLEAPGLHRFFDLEDKDISAGLIDIFNDYKDLLRKELKSLPEQLVDIQRYIRAVEEFRGGGSISLLAAGRQDEKYAGRINEFSWEEFYAKWHGFGFIEYLKKELKSSGAEIVLVDSRTGVTDIGGICTLQLPDAVVLLFALNDQNIRGAESVAQKISQKAVEIEGRDRPPILIIRPSRVERTGNQKEKIKWQNIAAVRLGEYLDDEDPERFMAKKNIPYIGDYSYGETPLAVQKDRLGDMSESFEDIASSILKAADSGNDRREVKLESSHRSTLLSLVWKKSRIFLMRKRNTYILGGTTLLILASAYFQLRVAQLSKALEQSRQYNNELVEKNKFMEGQSNAREDEINNLKQQIASLQGKQSVRPSDGTWAIIVGGYEQLTNASNQADKVKGLGYVNVKIYKKGTYRVSIIFNSQQDALDRFKVIQDTVNAGAYGPVNINNWCQAAVERDGISECQNN